MSITISIEKLMEEAFNKFHNNVKFYGIEVSLELLDHLDTLEAAVYRLSKETRTTEMEDSYEDGFTAGVEVGGEDAYEAGYEQGYDLGYEAGITKFGDA